MCGKDGGIDLVFILIVISIIYTANMSGHIAENTLNIATLQKQQSETPQEWDYEVIKANSVNSSLDDLDFILIGEGKEYWELVSVSFSPDGKRWTSMILKRPRKIYD